MAQLGEIPGLQEFGNSLMQYANMEQRQKHQAETERIAREGRAFQETKESAIAERALSSAEEINRHHKATEGVAQKKLEADEAVRKEQQRGITLDNILTARGFTLDSPEYKAQEDLIVNAGFAERNEGKPAITSLEKLDNYGKMIALNAGLAQNQAKIEIANADKKIQDLTMKMQKLQDPATGQVLPEKEKEYDALAVQHGNLLDIIPALKTAHAQAPLMAHRNKALASLEAYSKAGEISDADAQFLADQIRRNPDKTDDVMKQAMTTAANREARIQGAETKADVADKKAEEKASSNINILVARATALRQAGKNEDADLIDKKIDALAKIPALIQQRKKEATGELTTAENRKPLVLAISQGHGGEVHLDPKKPEYRMMMGELRRLHPKLNEEELLRAQKSLSDPVNVRGSIRTEAVLGRLDDLINMARELDNGNVKPLNSLINNAKAMFGNVNAEKARDMANAIVLEIAPAMTGIGQSTDFRTKLEHAIIDLQGKTPAQVEAGVNELKKSLTKLQEARTDVSKQTRKALGPVDPVVAKEYGISDGTSSTPQAQTPAPTTKKLPSGATYTIRR